MCRDMIIGMLLAINGSMLVYLVVHSNDEVVVRCEPYYELVVESSDMRPGLKHK